MLISRSGVITFPQISWSWWSSSRTIIKCQEEEGGIIACIHTSLSETELKGWERERDETKSLKANMSVWAYWAEHSSEQRYCGVCRRDTLHADRPAVRAAFKAEPISFWSPKSCILMWFSFSSSHAVVKVFSSFWANFWFASGLWWNMHEDQNTTT